MSTRWLAGLSLFVLGFGSASLVTLSAVGAASKEGVVEGNLKYIDSDDFRLVYPSGGKNDYLVVVSRKPGTVKEPTPNISYATGLVRISKKGLQSLVVYKPIIIWKGDVGRCGQGPFWWCPLPPPPPPPEVIVVKSGPAPLGRPD